jgi:hypothetical protein
MNRLLLINLIVIISTLGFSKNTLAKDAPNQGFSSEFKALKYLFRNKRITKNFRKKEYDYGPFQIGPGAPVIAKAIIKIKRKIVYIENKKFILEELQIGKRLGVYFNLGTSVFSFWKIKVLYSENQVPSNRSYNTIIDSILKKKTKQKFLRMELSYYKGKDLILGIESPKYIMSFYNLALRTNLIKNNFIKKIIHNTHKRKFIKTSSGFSNEVLSRFFSELYGLDQNHLYSNIQSKNYFSQERPLPDNPNFNDLSYILKTLDSKKINLEKTEIDNKSNYLEKEIYNIKKASLFGIINKKWIKHYLKKEKEKSKNQTFYQSEKSSWSTFFRKEAHSLFIGLAFKKKCTLFVNISLKDSKLTNNERKIYNKEFGLSLKKNIKKGIIINRQILLTQKAIEKITKLECSFKNKEKIIKKFKKIIPKKIHYYKNTALIKILTKLPKEDFVLYDYLSVKNKYNKITKVGLNANDRGILNQLKLKFAEQF